MTDPFWQEQIALHVANRGKHADPAACGTCRRRTANGETVEHDECARKATLIEAPDVPNWELLIEMTEQEKADLPARFHTPRFDDSSKPNAWLCAVCWGDGWGTVWPCATAVKHGSEVFSWRIDTERERKQQQDEMTRLRGEVASLAAENAILERALGLNEAAAA